MSQPRHVLLTGAAGFLGSRVASALLRDDRFADCRFTFIDRSDCRHHDPRVRSIAGDLCDSALRAEAIGDGADIVLHLAGLLGGAAERDPALSRKVNLDASLDLIAAAGNEHRPPQFVFASSIAVFGPPLPAYVDDASPAFPVMTYGAHKRMVELFIEHSTLRGRIRGLSLRLPGIVARPDADARLRSAFLNTIFFDYAAGRDIALPVGPEGRTWLISVPACVAACLDTALVDLEPLGRLRSIMAPALHVSFAELIEALGRRFPESRSRITFAPDPDIVAQFASYPPLGTPGADALGLRNDGSVEALVAHAMPADHFGD